MGMFDTLYDERGNDWQTKAFSCGLEQYRIGDTIPYAHPEPFQVEVLGTVGKVTSEFVDGYAFIENRILKSISTRRDESVPLMAYTGGWL